MSIEDKTWRKYERQIHQELTSVFTDCEFEFDDRIFDKHSKIDRQIDISIRGNIGGNKILGIIDCKHFSKNIDIKIIESFLGMLEDTKANFGLIITNKGFSSSAKHRANVRNLRLDIIEFDELQKIKLTFDYFVNQKIRNLELSKYEFFKRARENSGYFDLSKSDYNKRIITFKEGFANTEYYAFKKIIKESARLFRDFTDLEMLTIRIPANKENKKQAYQGEKPNIIFLLADDMGYGELGSYGQKEIKTPFLDSLATKENHHNYKFFKSSGELTGAKRDLYEGGVREPMIAYWKNKIKAGTTSNLQSTFYDIMPTFAEVAGTTSPNKTDGISILPELLGQENQQKHDFLYFEIQEGRSVKGFKQATRFGKWKAVRIANSYHTQLFDLSTDISEKNDVSKQHPDLVKKANKILKRESVKNEHFPYSGGVFKK